MNAKLRNLFLLFGIVAIGFMLYKFDVTLADLKLYLRKAGLYLPLIVSVWIVVYAFNAKAFQLIVNNNMRGEKFLPFLPAYKLTVSGFAFSYTTPFGFGGGPYRVMELSSYIGTRHAISSVALYSMMHILSHFCLWATAVVLYICCYEYPAYLWSFFGLFFFVFLIVLFFFYYGYNHGMLVKLIRAGMLIPFLGRPIKKFYAKQEENLKQIDLQIAYLHENARTFYASLLMEYLGRVVNAFEYYFILLALVPSGHVTYLDALMVLAFSSLIGNLLFFFPMQLGAREGSLTVILRLLYSTIDPSVGIIASLYTRIREMFWIVMGVVWVKFGNNKIMK